MKIFTHMVGNKILINNMKELVTDMESVSVYIKDVLFETPEYYKDTFKDAEKIIIFENCVSRNSDEIALFVTIIKTYFPDVECWYSDGTEYGPFYVPIDRLVYAHTSSINYYSTSYSSYNTSDVIKKHSLLIDNILNNKVNLTTYNFNVNSIIRICADAEITITLDQLKWMESISVVDTICFNCKAKRSVNSDLIEKYVIGKYKFNTIANIMKFLNHFNGYYGRANIVLPSDVETKILTVLNDKVNHNKKSMKGLVKDLIYRFGDAIDWSKLNDDSVTSLFPKGMTIGKYKLGVKEFKSCEAAKYIHRRFYGLPASFTQFLTLSLVVSEDELDGFVEVFVGKTAQYIASEQYLSPSNSVHYDNYGVIFTGYYNLLMSLDTDHSMMLKMFERYVAALQLEFVSRDTEAMYRRFSTFFSKSGLEAIIKDNKLEFTLHPKLRKFNMETKLKR